MVKKCEPKNKTLVITITGGSDSEELKTYVKNTVDSLASDLKSDSVEFDKIELAEDGTVLTCLEMESQTFQVYSYIRVQAKTETQACELLIKALENTELTDWEVDYAERY